MRQFIDVTGKTEDEAISRALEQLGLDRDEVSVEVLERAKTGFLGIGSCPAKVKVTYEVPDEEIPAPPENPAPAVRTAERTERKDEDRTKAPAKAKDERTAAQQPESGDEKAAQIERFLTGLLAHMGAKAKPVIQIDDEGNYQVELVGEGLGALIGRRGETLDAIQQLTSYSVNRTGSRVRVQLDAENYRAKREQSLERLANKVAAKVVKYRRSVTLEPMNAYERHVIHTALQDTQYITTFSIGTEPNRRVVVSYDRTKQ